MKAFLSVTIILIVTLASFAAPAPFEVKESSKANVFTIQYQSTHKGKVEVSILDSESKVIFTEVIKNMTTFVRPYNFSNLPEGVYLFRVEDESGQHLEPVVHSLEETAANFFQVAPLPNQENKFWLNVYSNGSETVNVRILAKTRLLFEQSVSVSGNHNVVYDLNQVKENDQVTFEVTDSKGQLYTATF